MKKFLVFSILFVSVFAQNLNQYFDKYSLDSDRDGYPNFLEQKMGTNPNKHVCMDILRSCGGIPEDIVDIVQLSKPQQILIILDASSSMNSSNKMKIAKEILSNFLKKLPPSIKAGLIVYSHKSSGCNSIELEAPIGTDKNSIVTTIQNIRPRGLTPIAASLKKAYDVIKNDNAHYTKILLVSDGQETCGGHPWKVAADIVKNNKNIGFEVLGFMVSGRTERQLKGIAKITGGVYRNIRSKGDFIKFSRSYFQRMNEMINAGYCMVKKFAEYQMCENNQFTKAEQAFINIKSSMLGDTSKIDEVEIRVRKRHEYIQKNALKFFKRFFTELKKELKK